MELITMKILHHDQQYMKVLGYYNIFISFLLRLYLCIFLYYVS